MGAKKGACLGRRAGNRHFLPAKWRDDGFVPLLDMYPKKLWRRILANHHDVCFSRCGEERQSCLGWRAFPLNCLGAKRECSLKCDRPFFGQDEHSVSRVFDPHCARHAWEEDGECVVPNYREHFIFPNLLGPINADWAS
jgi:hypothetical protein